MYWYVWRVYFTEILSDLKLIYWNVFPFHFWCFTVLKGFCFMLSFRLVTFLGYVRAANMLVRSMKWAEIGQLFEVAEEGPECLGLVSWACYSHRHVVTQTTQLKCQSSSSQVNISRLVLAKYGSSVERLHRAYTLCLGAFTFGIGLSLRASQSRAEMYNFLPTHQ